LLKVKTIGNGVVTD